MYQFTNYASARLNDPLDAVAVNAVLQAGQGALFPTPAGSLVFQATIEDTDGNFEVVTVTERIGDVLTLTRAQESTTAQSFPAGSVVELRMTAAQLNNFLQKTGGQMAGALDMNNNELQNALLDGTVVTGGRTVGTVLRGSDDGATNQIEIPSGGAAPTLGGNVIFHAGIGGEGSGINADLVRGEVPLSDTRQIITPADKGLTGGGALDADITLEFDSANLPDRTGFLVPQDKFLVRDSVQEDARAIEVDQAFALPVDVKGTPDTVAGSYTLALTDALKMIEFDSTDALTLVVPSNTSVAFKLGTMIPVRRRGTGTVTIAPADGTVVIESPNGWLDIDARYGMVCLIKRGTNLWALEGRLGE